MSKKKNKRKQLTASRSPRAKKRTTAPSESSVAKEQIDERYVWEKLKLQFKEYFASHAARPIDPFVEDAIDRPSRKVANTKELSKLLNAPEQDIEMAKDNSRFLMRKPIEVSKATLELLAGGHIEIQHVVSNKKVTSALLQEFIQQYVAHSLAELKDELKEDSSEEDSILDFYKHWYPQIAGDVLKTDKLAVALSVPKTAAIFFDRVWCLDPETPKSVRFVAGAPEEFLVKGLLPFMTNLKLDLHDKLSDSDWFSEIASVFADFATAIKIEANFSPKIEQMLCVPIHRRTGLPVCAFTASKSAHDGHLGNSVHQALALAFDSIPIIDESKLVWKQVLEVRRDNEARTKIRRLVHWIEGELKSNSLEYLRDEIHLRIDDYLSASKKHGMEVSTGCLEAVMDWKAILTLLGASAATYSITDSHPLLIAEGLAGAAFLGNALLKSRRIARNLKSDLDANPVAFLCEFSRSQSSQWKGLPK
jgi:hypothetical protein